MVAALDLDFQGEHVSVIGASTAVEHLDKISERIGDMTEIMEGALRDVMIRSAQLTFRSQGRPVSWPAIEETKRKRGTDLILEDTLKLLRSLSPDGNEFSLRGSDAHSTYIGTIRPGASNHQEGVTVPQRKFLLSMPEDIEDEKAIIVDFVIHGFTGAPGGTVH